MRGFSHFSAFLIVSFAVTLLSSLHAAAQSSTTSTSSTPLLTTATVSTSFTTTTVTRSNGQDVTVTTVLPTSFNVTLTISPTATPTDTTTATPTPVTLDTKIDPGFAVLGVILILTGLPSTFWGHKNRWSSFFLIGFYTFALACLALILRFGVLDSINPPNKTLRGVFVLACCVAGIGGGGIAIFFWQQAKYFIGAWGGFALGLWVQSFRNGGLIRQIGFRWILYIGLGVVGFCACTIPKFHYPTLLTSTAIVGATAFVLGIDCFTTAGLKEFYVWNLGFDNLFPKFKDAGIQFPVTQMMQIELGLIGAFALMGMAVQLRILKILQIKLREIKREQQRRDEELEAQATARFAATTKEMEEWEKQHGKKGSSSPLIKDSDINTPATEETSQFTLPYGHERRQRYQSGVSDFVAAPRLEDDLGRPVDRRQSIGVLPAMDLGLDIEGALPKEFVDDSKPSTTSPPKRAPSIPESEDLKRKEELIAEIQSIRKSIEMLRAETPSSHHSGTRSRNQSFTSRRTLSQDLATVMQAPTRPPRVQDPRARVSSLDMLQSTSGVASSSQSQDGASINRPSSAPLQDNGQEWDAYVRERKLYQPPAGVTMPITTTHAPQPKRAAVPHSVTEALMRRQQQANVLDASEFGQLEGHAHTSTQGSSSDGREAHHHVHNTAAARSSKVPTTILPPRKQDPPPATKSPPPKTRTFEELNERHRQMMRNLQGPLSRAERERAEVEEARQRWERSKALEKQAMAKKEAEKSKDKKGKGGKDEMSPSRGHPDRKNDKSHRPQSADMLAVSNGAGGSTSKRQSMLKVEDWRRHQQDVPGSAGQSRRDSDIPFPGASRDAHRSTGEGRRSQTLGPSGRKI